MPANSDDPALVKTRLRAAAKARRAGVHEGSGPAAAKALARYALSFLDAGADAVVAAFASMPDELDTGPLLARLHALGHPLCLPVMQGKTRPLAFRAYAPGDAMDTAIWGIREPKPDRPLLTPDVLLVPVLAFDGDGWRLGYGGGYYDRTLRALRRARPIVAIGLAYDAQQVDAVPHLDYDERLDWVLTPSGPRQF